MTTVSEKHTNRLYNLRTFPNKIFDDMISYHLTSSSSHVVINALKPLLISEANALLNGCLLNSGLDRVKVNSETEEFVGNLSGFG